LACAALRGAGGVGRAPDGGRDELLRLPRDSRRAGAARARGARGAARGGVARRQDRARCAERARPLDRLQSFRHFDMKALRSSPFIFFDDACLLQSVVRACCFFCAGLGPSSFRHSLMNFLRSSPFIFLPDASLLQSFIRACCSFCAALGFFASFLSWAWAATANTRDRAAISSLMGVPPVGVRWRRRAWDHWARRAWQSFARVCRSGLPRTCGNSSAAPRRSLS